MTAKSHGLFSFHGARSIEVTLSLSGRRCASRMCFHGNRGLCFDAAVQEFRFHIGFDLAMFVMVVQVVEFTRVRFEIIKLTVAGDAINQFVLGIAEHHGALYRFRAIFLHFQQGIIRAFGVFDLGPAGVTVGMQEMVAAFGEDLPFRIAWRALYLIFQ